MEHREVIANFEYRSDHFNILRFLVLQFNIQYSDFLLYALCSMPYAVS